MSTGNHREIAKVYQFPEGGRAGLARRGEKARLLDERSKVPAYVPVTACGCWYHEEALQEADTDRTH